MPFKASICLADLSKTTLVEGKSEGNSLCTMFLFDGVDVSFKDALHVTHKYFPTDEHKDKIIEVLKSYFSEKSFVPFVENFTELDFFGKDKDVRVLRPKSNKKFLLDLKDRLDEIEEDKWGEYKPHVSVSSNVDSISPKLGRYILCRDAEILFEAPIRVGDRVSASEKNNQVNYLNFLDKFTAEALSLIPETDSLRDYANDRKKVIYRAVALSNETPIRSLGIGNNLLKMEVIDDPYVHYWAGYTDDHSPGFSALSKKYGIRDIDDVGRYDENDPAWQDDGSYEDSEAVSVTKFSTYHNSKTTAALNKETIKNKSLELKEITKSEIVSAIGSNQLLELLDTYFLSFENNEDVKAEGLLRRLFERLGDIYVEYDQYRKRILVFLEDDYYNTYLKSFLSKLPHALKIQVMASQGSTPDERRLIAMLTNKLRKKLLDLLDKRRHTVTFTVLFQTQTLKPVLLENLIRHLNLQDEESQLLLMRVETHPKGLLVYFKISHNREVDDFFES